MSEHIILQWNGLRSVSESRRPSASAQAWRPNTDICEHPDGLLVRLELAGVPEQQINIQLTEQKLTVSGNRLSCLDEKGAVRYRFRQLEIEYGAFHREITLSYPVDAKRVEARMRDGLLEIQLPRARSGPARAIKVNIEE